MHFEALRAVFGKSEENRKKKFGSTFKNFEDLIEICLKKKDMKLKYELENNVNLVSFSNMNIEISINDKLNKNFIKDLSEKLYDWTKNRWLISFSKEKVSYLESVVKIINNRQWNIRSAIDWRKFVSGA